MRGPKKEGGKMYAGWEPTLNFIVITSQMGFAGTRGMRVGVLPVPQKAAISEATELKGSQTRLNSQITSFIKAHIGKSKGKGMG